MKYTGKFKNRYNETFKVYIVTNKDETQETELTLADESPVVITVSSDNIFAPIKSRSCTIKVVTKEPLLDIYSATSHGTTVEIYNLSQGVCIFQGYVTPCEYNQSFVYLNELEIEAVDCISTLRDFQYTYSNGGESYISVLSLVKRIMNTAGVKGAIYIPFYANKCKLAYDNNKMPMEFEFINDDIFFSKDGKADDYYACLEEVCNFYGLSCVPYGNDIYFVDYDLINNGDNYYKNIKGELDEVNPSRSNYFAIEQTTDVDTTPVLWIDSINGKETDINCDMQGVGVQFPFIHIFGQSVTVKDKNNNGKTLFFGDGQTHIITDGPNDYYTLTDSCGNVVKVSATGDKIKIGSATNPNLVTEVGYQTLRVGLTETIGVNDYAGEDQNIEMDEVYNKITVESDVKEIDEDKFYVDPLDNVHKAAYIKKAAYNYWTTYDRTWKKFLGKTHREHLESTYTIYDRTFYYTQKQINNKPTCKEWQCYTNTNVWDEGNWFLTVPCLHDMFSKQYMNYIDIDSTPTMQMRLDRYEYQWCTINQQFGWKQGEDVPIQLDWEPYIEFHTGVGAWARYYNDQNSGWENTDGTHLTTWQSKVNQYGTSDVHALWWLMYANEMMCNPVLEYESETMLNYSPATNSKINYICFTGDLLFQKAGNYGESGKYHHDIWQKNANGNFDYKSYLTFPLVDAGYNDSEQIMCQRGAGEANYNKGFECLKCKLQIGDRWWNGSSWVNYDTHFWIYYHYDNVAGDVEKLLWYQWNKPVTNHTFESGINKECYAIPVKFEDGCIVGKMKFSIYNPLTRSGNALLNQNGYLKINTYETVPVVYMKGLSLSFVSTKNSGVDNYYWINDIENPDEEDDIIYSNSINTNNVLEFDDLSLKIATYNDKIPLTKSYVLEPISTTSKTYKYSNGNFYNSAISKSQRQELNVIEKYYKHHKTPKMIYNCCVHGYKAPYKLMETTALGHDVKMIVDEQEYDVKADINNLKIIQY